MNDKEKEERKPDHENGHGGKDHPKDHGRPVPHHGSAAMSSVPHTKTK